MEQRRDPASSACARLALRPSISARKACIVNVPLRDELATPRERELTFAGGTVQQGTMRRNILRWWICLNAPATMCELPTALCAARRSCWRPERRTARPIRATFGRFSTTPLGRPRWCTSRPDPTANSSPSLSVNGFQVLPTGRRRGNRPEIGHTSASFEGSSGDSGRFSRQRPLRHLKTGPITQPLASS
jgi:hypothetical protein